MCSIEFPLEDSACLSWALKHPILILVESKWAGERVPQMVPGLIHWKAFRNGISLSTGIPKHFPHPHSRTVPKMTYYLSQQPSRYRNVFLSCQLSYLLKLVYIWVFNLVLLESANSVFWRVLCGGWVTAGSVLLLPTSTTSSRMLLRNEISWGHMGCQWWKPRPPLQACALVLRVSLLLGYVHSLPEGHCRSWLLNLQPLCYLYQANLTRWRNKSVTIHSQWPET